MPVNEVIVAPVPTITSGALIAMFTTMPVTYTPGSIRIVGLLTAAVATEMARPMEHGCARRHSELSEPPDIA